MKNLPFWVTEDSRIILNFLLNGMFQMTAELQKMAQVSISSPLQAVN